MKAEKPTSVKTVTAIATVVAGVIGFNLLAAVNADLALICAGATVVIAAACMIRAILK